MSELTSVLNSVRDRIARYRGQGIGEENTKTALIDPVLRALGWDLEDLDEVRHEYRRKPVDNPVDYALLLLRTPRLFVEAKALGENLADHRWASQFIGYAGVAGVEWVAVTDGNEWRIYNAHASVPIEEKLFQRATFDFPLVAAAVERVEPKERTVAVPSLAAKEEPARRAAGAGTPWRNVTLAELIGAGLVRVPVEIEHRYRGTQVTARIEDASHISFGGSVYESLSLAGGMARKAVVGAPSGREYPQTNGWTFWKYRRADGTLGALDELRRACFAGKVVNSAGTRRIGA